MGRHKLPTVLDGISVKRGIDPQLGPTPSEEAVIVAMKAQGANDFSIARELGRCEQFVQKYRSELREKIEQYRLEIREPIIEDCTDILMMVHLEHKDRLLDPEKRAKIRDNDLTNMARHYFNISQIMKSEPTQITDTRSGQVIDLLLLAKNSDENFEMAMRALISRKGEEMMALPEGESPMPVPEAEGEASGLPEGEVIDVEPDSDNGSGSH